MNIFLDLKNYDDACYAYERTAARGVIMVDNKVLLIRSKYGDYKFPGGGMEGAESICDTLLREVREETGYKVILSSIRKIGHVQEVRRDDKGCKVTLYSYYFMCKVENEIHPRKLDIYEKVYGYEVKWMPLQQALVCNKEVLDMEMCPWTLREIKVMEFLQNNMNAKG